MKNQKKALKSLELMQRQLANKTIDFVNVKSDLTVFISQYFPESKPFWIERINKISYKIQGDSAPLAAELLKQQEAKLKIEQVILELLDHVNNGLIEKEEPKKSPILELITNNLFIRSAVFIATTFFSIGYFAKSTEYNKEMIDMQEENVKLKEENVKLKKDTFDLKQIIKQLERNDTMTD